MIIPEYQIIKYTKNNEHKFSGYIKNIKLKDIDIEEIKNMGSNVEDIIKSILNFDSENIYLIFVNKYGLVAIFGSKELNLNSCYVWMITTKDIYKLNYKFAKYTYDLILHFHKIYDQLLTYKYIKDKKGYKWLKYNGFYKTEELYFNNKYYLMIKNK